MQRNLVLSPGAGHPSAVPPVLVARYFAATSAKRPQSTTSTRVTSSADNRNALVRSHFDNYLACNFVHYLACRVPLGFGSGSKFGTEQLLGQIRLTISL
jgi:hypothetical protein